MTNNKQNANIICNIIIHELGLEQKQVAIYNQNYEPPTLPGLYITVGFQSSKIVATTKKYDGESDRDIQSLLRSSTYWIEITSENSEALERQGEVVLAMTSRYSQQKQETNGIQIAKLPGIMDLSLVEGPSALNRYRFSVALNSVEQVIKKIDTYDGFKNLEVIQ